MAWIGTHQFDATDNVRTVPGIPLNQDKRLKFLASSSQFPDNGKAVRAKHHYTHKAKVSILGKNSLSLATLSRSFLPRSIDERFSQCGSKGCTSVITSTKRSWATPKEHSVRNVAFPPVNFIDRMECDCDNDRRGLARPLELCIVMFCRLTKGFTPSAVALPEVDFDGDSSS